MAVAAIRGVKRLAALPRLLVLAASVLLVVAGGWLAYLRLLPGYACRILYERELAELQSVVAAVEGFQAKHGRLPNPYPHLELQSGGLEPAASHGYRLLDDGTFSVHYLAFDGPTISYTQADGEWRCAF